MNKRHLNTYQSITLYFYPDCDSYSNAIVYTSIHNVKLNQMFRMDYQQGKKALAQLMLRLYKMPEVRDYGVYRVYDLQGFLD